MLDPQQSWFVEPGANALDQWNRESIATLIAEMRRATGARVFVATNDRAGVVLLESLAQLSAQNAPAGALLVSPNLFEQTPAPGEPGVFAPAVNFTTLPVFLFVPERSVMRLRAAELADAFAAGGAPVWLERLADARDRFFFRPDATPTEAALGAELAARITRALPRLAASTPAAPPSRPTATVAATHSPAASPAAPTRVLLPYRGALENPGLSRPDLDGNTQDLADYRGRVVLLNFWASWCPPCVHEIPSMARVQERLRAQGFAILAVNLGENPADIRAFLERHPVNFPVLVDPDQAEPHRWRVFAFPTSYLLDKTGRIRFAVAGGIDWEETAALAAIEGLLAEPSP
ncbi:MAG: TlpA family protein disulfide reductase [Chromatiales bacterium]|nr:TlpA family protein disulfide reductase [Chromatiales bacterium]